MRIWLFWVASRISWNFKVLGIEFETTLLTKWPALFILGVRKNGFSIKYQQHWNYNLKSLSWSLKYQWVDSSEQDGEYHLEKRLWSITTVNCSPYPSLLNCWQENATANDSCIVCECLNSGSNNKRLAKATSRKALLSGFFEEKQHPNLTCWHPR